MAKDNARAIPANALCQIIGIAPTLVVVQVQAGLSEADRGRITFDHRSGSAPIVVSIDQSTLSSYIQEIPEKGGVTV